MSLRSVIAAQFVEVAQQQSRGLPQLEDDLALLDSGLDSLCFAIIVARLEDKLAIDPFSASEDAAFPVTFGEFVKLYENVAA